MQRSKKNFLTQFKDNLSRKLRTGLIAPKSKDLVIVINLYPLIHPFKWIMRLKIRKYQRRIINNDFLFAGLVSLFLIFVGVVMAWYNHKIIPQNSISLPFYVLEPHNPLRFLANWDGVNYIRIAKYGYRFIDTNFFPFYPLVIYILHFIFKSYLISSLVISWTSLIFASYFYIRISKLLFRIKDNYEALKSLAFFILFPTGMFLIVSYSEALMAALLLGAIYYTLTKKYIYAGLLLAFATAARVDGVFGILLVGLLMLEQKEKILKILSITSIGSIGVLSYCLYLWAKFKNPIAFIDAQKQHGWLVSSYSVLISHLNLLKIGFAFLCITTIIYWWNRKRSFSIYSALFLIIPILGRQFGGFNRYMLLCFPLQLMLYETLRKKRLAYSGTMFISILMWTYYLFTFTSGYVGG